MTEDGKKQGKGTKEAGHFTCNLSQNFSFHNKLELSKYINILYSKFWTIFNKLNWSSLTLGTKFKSVYFIVSVQFFFREIDENFQPQIVACSNKMSWRNREVCWVFSISLSHNTFDYSCGTTHSRPRKEKFTLDHMIFVLNVICTHLQLWIKIRFLAEL